METPPQFPGAPKKSKTGLVLGIIFGAVLLCCGGCAGLIWYVVSNGKGAFSFVGCGASMSDSRDALLAYANAHKGTLPQAQNWQTAIKPYLKNTARKELEESPFKAPDPTTGVCDPAAKTSLTLNADIAGKKVAEIKDQMGTIAIFETAGLGQNKFASWAEPPHNTSPVLFMGARRGWIRQGLKGEAALRDQTGKLTPVSNMKGGPGGVNVETKVSTGAGDESR